MANAKSTILNKKLASNQSNMLQTSAASNLREMRPLVCTPVEDTPLE